MLFEAGHIYTCQELILCHFADTAKAQDIVHVG